MGLGLKKYYLDLNARFMQLGGFISKNDALCLSVEKSGRTWVRFTIANYLALNEQGLSLQNWDDFHKYCPGVQLYSKGGGFLRRSSKPRVFFTHFNYVKHVKKDFGTAVFIRRKLIDIAQSKFFFDMFRYDDTLSKITFAEYVKTDFPLEKIVILTNDYRRMFNIKEEQIFDYENLKKNPSIEFTRLFETIFRGDVNQVYLKQAIEYSSMDQMRMLEQRKQGQTEDKNARFVRGGTKSQDYAEAKDVLTKRLMQHNICHLING